MSTGSINHNIEITNPAEAERFVKALEKSKAESEEGMERLTRKSTETGKWIAPYGPQKITDRLAAYEDSGLSPDEVLELKEEYETEKSNSEATYAIMCGLTEEVERLKKCLAEYEQAKADGRLVERGTWINGYCSNCNSPIPTDNKDDYIAKNECRFCYYCGAKMEEAAEKALGGASDGN